MQQQLNLFGAPDKMSVLDIVSSLRGTVEGDLQRVFKDLKEAGFVRQVTWDSTQLYDQVWEHHTVTAHNKNHHILNNYFCTLYELAPNHRDLSLPMYRFVLGRIGNTTTWDIKEEV